MKRRHKLYFRNALIGTLIGLTSPRCPECGTAVATPADN